MTGGDPGGPVALGLRFRGRGGEYFRIWVVNVALSLLTLGIYSAWAKVRTRRYFYGCTSLDGVSFEYTADPVKILKGRILVVGFLAIYSLSGRFLPLVNGLLGLAALFLIPWVANRALAFNARYSSYRGLPFAFHGVYGEAFLAYIALPAAALLTLGLLYPYAVYRRKRYAVSRSAYGASRFRFDARPGQFYRIYLVAAGLAVGVAIAATVLLALGTGALAAWLVGPGGEVAAETVPEVAQALSAVGMVTIYAVAGLVVWVWVQVAVANCTYSHAAIGGNRLELRLRYGPMLWIQLSNLVLVVASLGLWIPFARVRLARYRLERMRLLAVEDLDHHLAAERAEYAATGAELGEAFDLDLGL